MRPFKEYQDQANRLCDLRKERELTFKESLDLSAAVGGMMNWLDYWHRPTAHDHIGNDE